jgi:ATP cone domain
MPTPRCPELVRKRDGRLVPFEADKISQSLYAATEDLGQPSAFLARELTDGVLHFLPAEVEAEPPNTSQIAELVTKVIRELGQPALAQAYAQGQKRRHQKMSTDLCKEKAAPFELKLSFSNNDPPQTITRRCLTEYSLQAVFGRDLAAAHEEGLLSLTGLEYPDELARFLMEPGDGLNGWLRFLNVPARTVIFDCPEYSLSEVNAPTWLSGLAEFCEATGRAAVLNLNVSPPPPWVLSPPRGPLFETAAVETDAVLSARVASILWEEASRLGRDSIRVIWHGGDSDSAPASKRRAGEGGGLSFVLDRPKKLVILAPGVDRQHAAALMDVGLGLPRFLGMAGIDNDAQVFLAKLPSLARMAVRVGVQKRNYLRSRSQERPGLTRGFLLERAALVVKPLGLDEVIARLVGATTGKLALDLRRQVIEVLQRSLQAESQATNLEIVVEDS